MTILEKIIGLGLADDLTETAWWTDTVYQGLAQSEFDTADAGTGIAAIADEALRA